MELTDVKIIAITKKKDYYRIGKDFNNSVWYNSQNVQDVEVKARDLVELDFEKEGKENILKSIKVTGQASATTATVGTSDTGSTSKGNTWRNKSPEESECIRKQTVGKMVAETVKALQGLSHDGIEDVVRNLFKVYDELTK